MLGSLLHAPLSRRTSKTSRKEVPVEAASLAQFLRFPTQDSTTKDTYVPMALPSEFMSLDSVHVIACLPLHSRVCFHFNTSIRMCKCVCINVNMSICSSMRKPVRRHICTIYMTEQMTQRLTTTNAPKILDNSFVASLCGFV
jgi:hypothetical protein